MTSSSFTKINLQKLRKEIEDDKPKPIDMKTLNPSDKSDWKMIKHFEGKMKKNIKDSFKKHLKWSLEITTLDAAGPTGPPYDNVLGNKWHKLLKDSVKGKETDTRYAEAVKSLLGKLKATFCVEALESGFPLYGYMKSERKMSPEVYLWQGEADVIGWFYNPKRQRDEYVIVDWKIKRDLLGFWDAADTFGQHLHQCLVYAKLFQLHSNLDYLPSVLIVPISGENGKDVQPGLFFDYPDECKKSLNDNFTWHAKFPESILHKVYGRISLFSEGVLNQSTLLERDKPLKDILKESATVGDLLEALGSIASSLKIISNQNFEDE